MKSVVIYLLLLISLTGCIKTAEGEKIGTVIKLSKQGLFCKTWEAEMVRFGVTNSNGASQSFRFTIENEKLLKEVIYSLENKQEMKVKYETRFGSMCASESNGSFLTEITRINIKSTTDRLEALEKSQGEILKQLEKLNKQ